MYIYMPKMGCWEAAEGRTESRDPRLEVGECSMVKDEALELPPGDARPSESSDGAGVQGGVSMVGMGWSLKQADS